jgi:hypothetical protein
MGMDFSYLLYFRKEQWLDALNKVISISDSHEPPTRLVFPDQELLVPMGTWVENHGVVRADAPTIDFSTSLFFEEDEAIEYYLRDRRLTHPDKCPPSGDETRRVAIGYVYLSIRNDLSGYPSKDPPTLLSLFNFGTPGTHMSLLFDESRSIQHTFEGLLASVPGICGVFNREDNGRVFWWRGRPIDDLYIDDPFLPLSDIGTLVDGN